jgi:Fe-S cluster biogenesis protein NfuA
VIDAATVTAGLMPVREVLQSDGGDIELVGVDGDTARLRLVLETAGCAECVLPRPMLETIALQMMQPLVPGLSAVAIDDPREPKR